jgi:hypothetical protein
LFWLLIPTGTGGGEKLILKRCPNPGLCLKMSHSLNEHPFYFLGI